MDVQFRGCCSSLRWRNQGYSCLCLQVTFQHVWSVLLTIFVWRFVPTSQSFMSVDAEKLEDGAVQGVMSRYSVNIMIKWNIRLSGREGFNYNCEVTRTDRCQPEISELVLFSLREFLSHLNDINGSTGSSIFQCSFKNDYELWTRII